MYLLITHLQLAIFALCSLLAAHFLFSSARKPMPSRLLGCNYVLYAIQSLLLVGMLHNWLGPLAILRPGLAMLIGPLFYFYFRSIREDNFSFSALDALHVAPCLLVLFMLLVKSRYLIWLDGLIILSFAGYLSYVGAQLLKGVSIFTEMGVYASQAFKWMCFLSALLAVSLAFELAIFLELQFKPGLSRSLSLTICSLALLVIFILIVFSSLRRHPLLEWMFTLGEQLGKSTDARMDDAYARKIFQQWQQLTDKDQLHKLEFGISIKDAAKKLGVPTRHLSNAINQEFGDSFSRYLNYRRVKDAQTLFEQSREKSVTDVMLESGFSSKSNFNKEFLRLTGKTPSAYKDAFQ